MNPTTGDLAAGADAVAETATEPDGRRVALIAVGGGSPIDAAKGIAIAAVSPRRGRGLDYRNEFAAPALPIVVVPTTAGTGAETNAFGVVTDLETRRKFYAGHATSMPTSAATTSAYHSRRHRRHPRLTCASYWLPAGWGKLMPCRQH